MLQQESGKEFAEQEPLELPIENALLHCPSCKHVIKGEDINIHKLIAKCSHCGHIFNFDHIAPRELSGYSRPDMLIPDGLEVLKLESELDIQVNWFRNIARASLAFTLIFTLIWNLILLPFVIAAIATGTYQILLFTSAHLAVGIGMLWQVLSIFMNTTHVNVTRRYLEIRTTPIPSVFKRNQKIPVELIQQLYVSKYVESRTNGNPNYAFALHVVLRNGRKLKLVSGMNEATQKYLEYEIESFLGIKDTPVEAE